MPVATFDTLKFANTLKAAGVPPQQAEAQAVAFAEVIQLNFKDLVTKDDLKATEKELRKETAELGKDLRQEIKDVEQRLTTRLDLMAAENKAYQATLRGDFTALRGDFTALRGEMVLIKWMLGACLTLLIGVAVRLLFFRGSV